MRLNHRDIDMKTKTGWGGLVCDSVSLLLQTHTCVCGAWLADVYLWVHPPVLRSRCLHRKVVLFPEESEDMWHAYNLIAVGDWLKSTTIR